MRFIATIIIESTVDENDSDVLNAFNTYGEEETLKQLATVIKKEVLENMYVEENETVNVVVNVVK